jgi:cation diffusion facilitator CzcD-associated flavoprotein CzcO
MSIDFKIGIIGAGFAGLVAALRLRKNGIHSFVIFERSDDIGGTWRDNIYPGCACDVASNLYSFADEPNPNWSHKYSGQEEIWNYMKDVVQRNNLQPHIRFNTDIKEARFIEDQAYWQVQDQNGNITRVKLLIAGLGPLNRPKLPDLPGLRVFKGKIMHSAEWDKNFDITNKNIAVVGTGASAVQVIPSIAPLVKTLTVFQRTPAWVAFRHDSSVSPFTRSIYSKFPFLFRIRRELEFWSNEFFGLGFLGNSTINKIMKWLASRKLSKEVKDPDTRKKLMPAFTIGCKRILRSDDYYPTFNLPHVQLVTEPITGLSEKAILNRDGKTFEVDAVIFCTGFNVADMNFPVKLIGKKGIDLVDNWKQNGGLAYKGTTVSGFPNFCLIMGPNTGLGHNSVVHMMESQMDYIMEYFRQLDKMGDKGQLDTKADLQDKYNREIQERFKGTVWSSGCKSWYLNEKGYNNTIYPGLNSDFRRIMRHFSLNEYDYQ